MAGDFGPSFLAYAAHQSFVHLMPRFFPRYSEVAAATATWGFIQSLGFVCGVAVPSNIFETKFRSLLYRISDMAVRESFEKGGAYEYASKAYMALLQNNEVKAQVIEIFVECLKLVWEVGIVFVILGFVVSFFIKDIE